MGLIAGAFTWYSSDLWTFDMTGEVGKEINNICVLVNVLSPASIEITPGAETVLPEVVYQERVFHVGGRFDSATTKNVKIPIKIVKVTFDWCKKHAPNYLKLVLKYRFCGVRG